MHRYWKALTILLLLPVFASCGNGGHGSCCDQAPVAGVLPGTSVWQLDGSWQDQSGASRRLRDFAGKPVVLAMIFTHCVYACPAIVADLRKIRAALPPNSDVQFVLASMDDRRDTPEVLAQFARDRGLDAARFTLLHGDADAVRDLAAAIAVRYALTANGDFSHSNLITLLDRSGRVAYRLEGIGVDPAPLLRATVALPKE